MQLAASLAENYRFRAEELRTISAAWLDGEARAMLDRVARDYDWMAEHLENGVLPPPREVVS